MFEKYKNKVITIEGPDGTGKDTITDILHKKISDSYVVRFPDRKNVTGRVIDKILSREIEFPDPLAFQSLQVCNKIETLITIDNLPEINPKIFIFCRYYESTMVYGKLDNIPVYLSQKINSVLPQSTITFILHGKKYCTDNEHYEDIEKQKKITQYYQDFAKQFGWKLINNMRSPKQIADDIINEIKRHKLI